MPANHRIRVGHQRYVEPAGRNVQILARGDHIEPQTVVIEQDDIPDLIRALNLFAEPGHKVKIEEL
jgi:hypothetical protein